MAKVAKPVNPAQLPMFDAPVLAGPTAMVRLKVLRGEVERCTLCELHKDRIRAVFGEGKWDRPVIAFIGEAPGAQEDQQGRPFVGASGQFLNRLIGCLGLKREDVYITNMVSCRPPKNRTPTAAELLACRPHWLAQIEAVQPQVVVALGKTAASVLTGKSETMYRLRGKWWTWKGIPLRVTWHPSYVLRTDEDRWGKARQQVWDDMAEVAQRLNLEIPKAVLDRVAAMKAALEDDGAEPEGEPLAAETADGPVEAFGDDKAADNDALIPLADLPAPLPVDNPVF